MTTKLSSLFLLSAAAAFGVDLWTPVIGTGYCTVSSATSATPIRITVANINRCNVTENSTIWVQGINNTGGTATRSAANIHMEDATDRDGLCRVARNVSGNRFDLYKCDGVTAVVPNGTYAYGGQIALAQKRTLKNLPIAYFDGEGGYVANCLMDTSPSGCANPSRGEWTRLQNTLSNLPDLTIPHLDFHGGFSASAAYGWWAQGKPSSSTYKTAMINSFMNSLPIPTPACDGTINCGYSLSGYSDYVYEVYAPSMINALNLGWSALDESQKAMLERYYLGDFPWQKGGHNFTGTSMNFTSFKPATGTITFAAGSAAITGDGTSFLTQINPNDYILIRYNESYARWYPVGTIASDTSLTLRRPIDLDFGNGTGFTFRLAEGWRDNGSDIGYLGWSHMNSYTLLCGAGLPNTTSCADYSPGSGGVGLDNMHNHQMGRTSYMLLMALTWAGTGISPRGEWLATDAMFVWYHNLFPAQTQMGGFSADSSHYQVSRILPYTSAVMGAMKSSFTDNPDYTGGGPNGETWWDEMAKFLLNTFIPGRNVSQFQHNGEGGGYPCCDNGVFGAFNVLLFKPNSSFAASLKHYMQTDWGEYLYSGYFQNRPDIVPVRGVQTSLITTAPLAPGCPAQWNAAICGVDRRFFYGSRSGQSAVGAWNGTGLNIFYNMQSTARRDHSGQVHEVGPQLAANGEYLLVGDGYLGLFDTIPHGNVFVIGPESNIKNGSSDGVGVSAPVYAHGTPSVAAAGVSTTGHYKAAANITAYRSIIHAKASGLGYVVLRDDFTSATAVTAQTYNHYNVSEGCGTPNASTCTMLNRAAGTLVHDKSNARINSSYLNGVLDTANSSDTDGSYPGQAGNTFRVTQALTGTGGSLFAVHQVSTSPKKTMPPILQSDADAYKIIEIQDPTEPVVVAVAPVAQVNYNNLAFTTTHSGTAQYVVTGLAAGTYRVIRNGTEIGASLPVSSIGHVLEFSSISGNFVIDTGPPPLSILQTQLPNAVLGKPYNGVLTGFSSTTPYQWDITSGSLCAGLTFTPGSPSAAVTGSAQTLDSCTFTVRVRDANNTETFSRQYTINVVTAGPGTVTILTTNLPAARVLDAYTARLAANLGTPPYNWSITTGALCDGLVLDSPTGTITGVPSGAGDCAFTVRATDLSNEFAERALAIARIPNLHTSLNITTAEASYSAAVVRFGRRGLSFSQSCTLDFRLGGAEGMVVQSLTSSSGPSRRELVASNLVAGQIYHLTATCGAESAVAQITTGFPAGQVRPVVLRMTRPTLNGLPVDAVVSFGATEDMPNSLTTPCSATECTAIVDTLSPLLYWRVRYRDAGGTTLAQSGTYVVAPR